MPRELITVQIGQCGIQLGSKFWDLALHEHAAHQASQRKSNQPAVYDDAMSTFFKNVDRNGTNLDVGSSPNVLKARAVLVDMEEGVLSEVMKGPLAELFDVQEFVKDVSGAGNNWAHGHEVYGPQYAEKILDQVRTAAEGCDSLQSFFIMHSLGGGTGSGLGTFILEQLEDHYPEIYRFVTAVFPSKQADVVTSPYNSMFSLSKLVDHADCVLPVENQALLEIVERIRKVERSQGADDERKDSSSSSSSSKNKRKGAFEDMNAVAASVLTNLTSSMRFDGSLNVDLNEITMNLVPYPGLHFLLPSVSPLHIPSPQKTQRRALHRGCVLCFHRLGSGLCLFYYYYYCCCCCCFFMFVLSPLISLLVLCIPLTSSSCVSPPQNRPNVYGRFPPSFAATQSGPSAWDLLGLRPHCQGRPQNLRHQPQH